MRGLLATLLSATVAAASAAGGTPPSDIAWPHPGEALRYHSCGCGDACWVADVVDRRSRVIKARLRCDCESLAFSPRPAASGAEVTLGRCEAINDAPDKPAAIRATLEDLRAHPPH